MWYDIAHFLSWHGKYLNNALNDVCNKWLDKGEKWNTLLMLMPI